MNRAIALLSGVCLAGLIAVAGTGVAVGADDSGFTDAQKKAIEQIVRDYLTKNPDILLEMSQELEKRQTAAQEAERKKAISENAELLFRSPRDHIAGNPAGDVTVVEFFEYNCPYCKRAAADLLKLIETDKKVRVVFKELPIFGQDSEDAAKLALAAGRQDKYLEMHLGLLAKPGKINKAIGLRVAKDLGLDVAKLEQDMKLKDVELAIEEARQVAEKIGLQGTPLYLVGDRVIPGAPQNLYEMLARSVADVRKNGCVAVC